MKKSLLISIFSAAFFSLIPSADAQIIKTGQDRENVAVQSAADFNEDTKSYAHPANSIYDITVTDIDGNEVSMADYKGKVLLIVNVASKCGLTPQYEELQSLYEKYQDMGFVVLAFPCNQFLGQEPGNNSEIKQFCSSEYNVTFPLFDKIDVNGTYTHQLYSFLKSHAPDENHSFAEQLEAIHIAKNTGYNKGNSIRWNFCKFLVSKDGMIIRRFEPMVSPERIEPEIQNFIMEKY